MDLMEFVIVEFAILIPVLYILGVMIKMSTIVEDEFIPILLISMGILLSIGLNGLNMTSLIQGILVAGVTVLGNETIRQLMKVGDN